MMDSNTRAAPPGAGAGRAGSTIMLVGASAPINALARQVAMDWRRVPDIYDALAAVGTRAGGRPTAAVVLSADLVNGSGATIRKAFAQIDPSVRVVVIAGNRQASPGAPGAPVADGAMPFDGWLIPDARGRYDADDLCRALGTSKESIVAARGAEVESGEAAPAAEPGGQAAEPPKGTHHTARPDPAPPPVAPDALDAPAPASTIASDSESETASIDLTAPLGDTDLLEAILSNPQGVERLALSLLRQQTGWDDLRLVQGGEDLGSAASGNVTFRQTSFGRLVSTQAGSSSQLQPWAEWLARWLAVDRAFRDFRIMAYRDELTGAWNRRFFNRFLHECIDRAREDRRPVTVMVYDLDDFKKYNDLFGHDAGDEILRETVRLLTSFIRKGDRVFRIGGDEFAVVFADPEAPRAPGSTHPDTVDRIARRFQDQVCCMKFPKLGSEAPGTLSISAGLATFPWDGDDPESLLRHADQLAMQSKQRGKNVLTLGPGARLISRTPDVPPRREGPR